MRKQDIIWHVIDSLFVYVIFNSITPGRYGSNFKSAISEHMLRITVKSLIYDAPNPNT